MSEQPPASLPPPPPPPGAPPPQYQPPPNPPQAAAPYTSAGSPGYIPPAIGPSSSAGGFSLGRQLGGAASPIVIGLVSIGVPFITSYLFNGSVFYFYVLPIFGLIYSIRAMMRGFVIGGIVGLVLNVLGGLVSLMAAGVIGT